VEQLNPPVDPKGNLSAPVEETPQRKDSQTKNAPPTSDPYNAPLAPPFSYQIKADKPGHMLSSRQGLKKAHPWDDAGDKTGGKRRSTKPDVRRAVVSPRREETCVSLKKLDLNRALAGDENEEKGNYSDKRGGKSQKKSHKFSVPTQKIIRDVVIPEYISVQKLASRMAERQRML